MIYGYNSKLHDHGIHTIMDYCAEFLEELQKVRSRDDEVNRPLVIIGHSFGGLIAAQALVKAKQYESNHRDPVLSHLYRATVALMFFATPHKGLLVDDIQNMLQDRVRPGHPRADLVEQIRKGSKTLAAQLQDFKAVLDDGSIRVVNFIEMHQTRGLRKDENGFWNRSGDYITVLSPDSAFLDLPDHQETKVRANANHSNIVKLDHKLNPIYQSALKYLREFVQMPVERRVPAGLLARPPMETSTISASTVRRTGFTVVHDNPQPTADIIFVPGFDGDSWRTWGFPLSSDASCATGMFWPATLLPRLCTGTRILTWGFENPTTFQQGFLDHAAGFLDALVKTRPLGRSTIFVAYSLGGLLIKEALRLAAQTRSVDRCDVLSCSAAVIFMGTPHEGDGEELSFRSALHQVLRVSQQTGPIATSAFPMTDYRLEACSESFAAQHKTHQILVKCFAEAHEPVVPKSVTTWDKKTTVELLVRRHSDLCRFHDASDPAYRKVSAEIEQCITHAQNREHALKQECLASLKFSELRDREREIAAAMDDTTTWVFEHEAYQSWLSTSEPRKSLLWLKGKPGSGKSMLMKEALRRVRETESDNEVAVIAYFFTTRGNVPLQKKPLGLFRTVLHDLVHQDKLVLSALIPEVKRKQLASPGAWDWNQDELQRILHSTYQDIPGVKRTVLFVDALDECEDGDENDSVRDLVYFFRKITMGAKIKICLSSRHYPHIKVPDCPEIVVEDFNSEDIQRFVDSKLSLADSYDERTARFARQITAKADGVFLWVTLIIKSLNFGLDNEQPDEDLEGILQSIPKKLEDVFKGLFIGDLSLPGDAQKAAAIFQWVLLAGRPLSMHQLRHALSMQFAHGGQVDTNSATQWQQSRGCLPADPRKFLISLRYFTKGLMECVDRFDYGGSTSWESVERPGKWLRTDISATGRKYYAIQFIHESAREYFLRGQGFATLEEAPRSIPERHAILAGYCMDCILGLASQVGRNGAGNVLDEYPFLEYSIEHLFYHTEEAAANGHPPGNVLSSLHVSDGQLWRDWSELSTELLARRYAFRNGRTRLHFLSSNRLFATGSHLLGMGTDIDERDVLRRSALDHAVSASDVAALRFLVRNGANLHTKNDYGQTPVHAAMISFDSELGLVEVLELFLGDKTCLDSTDNRGHSALHQVAAKGYSRAVSVILAHGGQPNLATRHGDTPLHLAANLGHIAVMQQLLRAGADPNAANVLGKTPLHSAACAPGIDGMCLLLAGSADINLQDNQGRTAVHIRLQEQRGVRFLLDAGRPFDMASRMINGRTPLHTAVFDGNSPENIEALLEHGADPNAVDNQGATPLHYAARRGFRTGIWDMLIAHGADVTLRDAQGETPCKK